MESNRLIFKGVGWMGILKVFLRVILFIRLAIMARILTPSDFGIFAISVLILSFLEIFTETGINILLIQENKNLDKYIDTAWIISILRGILIFSVIYLGASYVADFFETPLAVLPIRVISLVALLRGFINPSVVKFRKELEFSREFFFRFIVYFVESFFMVLFAMMSFSYMSFVYGMLAGVIIELLLSFLIICPKPRISFSKNIFKEIITKGKWVTLSGIFNYISEEGDDIIVGRVFGTYSLGVYQNSYKMSSLPVREIMDTFGKVAFPLYSKISSNKKKLKTEFLKILFLSSLVILPIVTVLLLFPRQIVMVLLGEKWIDTIPLIKILAIHGLVNSYIFVCYSLLFSLKKQDVVAKITFYKSLSLFIFIILLAGMYGISGVAYATVLSALTVIPYLIVKIKALIIV